MIGCYGISFATDFVSLIDRLLDSLLLEMEDLLYISFDYCCLYTCSSDVVCFSVEGPVLFLIFGAEEEF